MILRTNGPDKICWETEDLLNYGFKNFTRSEIPISDSKITRSEVMGEADFGKASVMRASSLSEPMMFAGSTAAVELPKGADISEVKRTYRDGSFVYSYHGWQVSSVPVTFNTVDAEFPEWKLINTDLTAEQPMSETETEPQDFGKKAENMLQTGIDKVKTGWEDAWEWIYDHDIAAAVVGMILILLLLPVLVIAYIRNRSSQRIRKQRQKEREERIRIEKDIDSKSVSEIEAELRAELEKVRLEEEKRNAEKKEILNKEE